MKQLYIMQGASGSGKSTTANLISLGLEAQGLSGEILSTDDFFINENGEYKFDRTQLQENHKKCYNYCVSNMAAQFDYIIVANTFTQKWEAEPYIKLAKEYGYTVQVIRCYGKFQNLHGVPEEKVQQMRNRMEDLI